MKICYVTHLPNLTGANQSLIDILSNLDNKKITPVVLLGKHGPLENELRKRNISYRIIPYSTEIKEKCILINYIKILKNKVALYRVKKFFLKEEFDLIHNNSLLVGIGMQAARKCNIPYVCHMRELIVPEHHVELINPDKQKLAIENAAMSIAISQCISKKFPYNNNCRVLFDGVDIEKYVVEQRDVFNELQTKRKINLFLPGRISEGKGQLEAIKAVEILKNKINEGEIVFLEDVNLYIVGSVGDETYNQKMLKYIKDHQLNGIYIMDFCNNLSELRLKCDIGLTCSKFEALGRVTIENMLSRLLVIGADADGTSEIVSEDRGILYEQGNPRDLAEKIIYAVNNEEKMKKIIDNAYKYARENFDASIYNEKLYEIYENI